LEAVSAAIGAAGAIFPVGKAIKCDGGDEVAKIEIMARLCRRGPMSWNCFEFECKRHYFFAKLNFSIDGVPWLMS
jgi:hypothetical protein